MRLQSRFHTTRLSNHHITNSQVDREAVREADIIVDEAIAIAPRHAPHRVPHLVHIANLAQDHGQDLIHIVVLATIEMYVL